MRPQSKGKVILVPRPVLAAMKDREESDILQSCIIKGRGSLYIWRASPAQCPLAAQPPVMGKEVISALNASKAAQVLIHQHREAIRRPEGDEP